MPFFDEGADPLDATSAPLQRAPMAPPPSDPFPLQTPFSEVASSTLRLDTTVGSMVNLIGRSPFYQPEPGYNPHDVIKGTEFENDPTDFSLDVNPAQTRARMDEKRFERNQREAETRGGTMGAIGGFVLGALDPTMWMPIVGEARGASLAGHLMRGAATGALSMGVQQGILQATQETHTTAESAENIATGTLLMGLLGGAHGFLSRGERASAEAGLNAVRRDVSPGAPDVAHGADGEVVQPAAPSAPQSPSSTLLSRMAEKYGADTSLEHWSAADRDAYFAQVDHDSAAASVPVPPAPDSIEGRIVDTVASLQGRPQEDGVRLSALREALPDIPRAELDRTLAEMSEASPSRAILYGLDNPRDIAAETASAMAHPTGDKHVLWVPHESEPVPANDIGLGMGVARDVGAAAADQRDMQLKAIGSRRLQETLSKVPVLGPLTERLGRAPMHLSPTLRIFSSASNVAKRAAGDLVETALRFTQGERGVSTARGGIPIDRQVKMLRSEGQLKATKILHAAFTKYRFGDAPPRLAGARAAIADLRGQADGKLSFNDFKREVSLTHFDGDAHDIPEVAEAAREVRRQVYDPMQKLLQSITGPDGKPMLAEELAPPKGDKSFGPRSWNTKALAADRGNAKTTFADWLQEEQAKKAATKDRLVDLQSQHEVAAGQVDKLEARLATLQRRSTETGTRLDERSMEGRAAGQRAETTGERAGAIRDTLSEVDEFISSMRDQVRDPDARQRLQDLEAEAADLRRASKVSDAEVEHIARGERDDVLPGELRKGAEVYLGRRRLPDRQGLLSHMIAEGGIRDTTGDVAQAIGGNRARPGLIRTRIDARDLDDWGERFQEMAPHAFPGGRPTASEVANIIDNAARGHEPAWWREHVEDPNGETARVRSIAEGLHELFAHTGDQPTSLREVVEALVHERGETPAVLQRLTEAAEAGRGREGAEATIAGRRQALADLRDFVGRGIGDRRRLGQREGVEGAREAEAGVAERRSSRRAQVLQDRLDRQSTMRDLLEAARSNAEHERDTLRGKMEDEVRGWEGNSSHEANRMLDAREENERVRGLKQEAGLYEGKGQRFTSADAAVRGAVEKILGSDRELPRDELESRADEILDRIDAGPDGRLPYDAPSGGPRVNYPERQQVRAQLNAREFAIPSMRVAKYLHLDTEHLVSTYLRTVLPDALLTARFGDADMTATFRALNEEYAAKAAAAGSERERVAVGRERKAMIRDLAAMRDRIRGVYGVSSDPQMRNMARIVTIAKSWSMLADLNSSVLNRLTDATNPIYQFGFMNVMRDGYLPFFKGLLRADKEFTPAAKQSMQDMLVGVDGVLGHTAHQFGDITENYLPGTKFERMLQWAVQKGMVINLHAPWTDGLKTISGTVAGAYYLRAAQRLSEGAAVRDIAKREALAAAGTPDALAAAELFWRKSQTARDMQDLAEAGIDQAMAARIWKAYSADGGREFGTGTHVANTADWADRGARDAFAAAIGRSADISVLTPGAERPLAMSKPVWSLLLQYKSFVAAAYERLLIANLQRRDARVLEGLAASIGMGLLSYRAYTLVAGQQTSDRPQDWIKEAVHRSAILGWGTDLNEFAAKWTGGKADVFRLIGADKPLSRHESQSALSEMLGPVYSKVEGIKDIVGDAFRGQMNASDIHKARELWWFQNHFAIRRALNAVEDGAASAIGVQPRDRSGTQWAH